MSKKINYAIRKDLPIPAHSFGDHGRALIYPWPEMEVGDSILCKSKHACSAANIWSKRNNLGKVFRSKKEENQWRVWRVK